MIFIITFCKEQNVIWYTFSSDNVFIVKPLPESALVKGAFFVRSWCLSDIYKAINFVVIFDVKSVTSSIPGSRPRHVQFEITSRFNLKNCSFVQHWPQPKNYSHLQHWKPKNYPRLALATAKGMSRLRLWKPKNYSLPQHWQLKLT